MNHNPNRVLAITCIIMTMLGGIAWIGTLNHRRPTPTKKNQDEKVDNLKPAVQKSAIRSRRLNKTDYQVVIHAQGTLQFPLVPIHAEVAGRIKSTAQDFIPGARVQPRQPLWVLDDEEFLDALAKAEATIQQILTEENLQKATRQSLKNSAGIAQANLDRAHAKLDLENILNRKARSDLERELLASNLNTDLRQGIVTKTLNEIKRNLSEATYSYKEANRVLKKARDKAEVEPLVIELISKDAVEAKSRMTAANDQIREMELKLRLPQINLAKRDLESSNEQLEKAMRDLAELPLAREHELMARLHAARIDQKKARANLNRVVITAPTFPSVVSRITVKDGDRVVPGTLMAEIQTADHAHAILSLPGTSLNHIKSASLSTRSEPHFPGTWVIHAANTNLKHQWSAQFSNEVEWRTDANKPENTVTATLRVNQPYQKIKNGINLDGLAIESKIKGTTLRGVYVLPKTAIRNSNEILLCVGKNAMRWQRVDIIWSEEDHVVTRGTLNGQPVLKTGARYCVEPQSIQTFLLPQEYMFKEVAN